MWQFHLLMKHGRDHHQNPKSTIPGHIWKDPLGFSVWKTRKKPGKGLHICGCIFSHFYHSYMYRYIFMYICNFFFFIFIIWVNPTILPLHQFFPLSLFYIAFECCSCCWYLEFLIWETDRGQGYWIVRVFRGDMISVTRRLMLSRSPIGVLGRVLYILMKRFVSSCRLCISFCIHL